MSYAGNGIWYDFFFSKYFFDGFKLLQHNQFFVRTKSQYLKRHSNCKISDKQQNDVSSLRHTSETVQDMKNIFSKRYLL